MYALDLDTRTIIIPIITAWLKFFKNEKCLIYAIHHPLQNGYFPSRCVRKMHHYTLCYQLNVQGHTGTSSQLDSNYDGINAG